MSVREIGKDYRRVRGASVGERGRAQHGAYLPITSSVFRARSLISGAASRRGSSRRDVVVYSANWELLGKVKTEAQPRTRIVVLGLQVAV